MKEFTEEQTNELTQFLTETIQLGLKVMEMERKYPEIKDDQGLLDRIPKHRLGEVETLLEQLNKIVL